MATPIAPVTVAAGTTTSVYVGPSHLVGAVVIANESPYALQVSAGGGAQWVLAQMADRLNCDTSAFGGAISITVSNYLSNSDSAPSFQVYLTAYAPGEPIPGVYPAALPRMLNLGNPTVTNIPANVLEQDLFGPFVYYGLTPTKDGGVANQLDITTGVAFVRQADSSLLRITKTATNFATATPTTPYYLDLNPDASWSWGTAHSTQSNYLSVAQVTTDGSGNISAVTDVRPLNPTLLSGMAGTVEVATLNATTLQAAASAEWFHAAQFGPFNATVMQPITFPAGTSEGQQFTIWDGAALKTPLAIGTTDTRNGETLLSTTGAVAAVAGQASAGSFGVPVIVAQALSTHVTTTATAIVLTFTPPADGLYRASLYAYLGNATSPATITADVNWVDPNDLAHTQTAYFTVQNASTGGVNPVTLKGASVATAAGANNIACFPICISVKSGQPQGIDLRWTDATGTPNDFVTAMIERLS